SKRTSPSSYGCTPARPLISVDLPAPLSPTSAVTLPGYTFSDTPLSTLTGPKLFLTSLSSIIGTSMDVPSLRRLAVGRCVRDTRTLRSARGGSASGLIVIPGAEPPQACPSHSDVVLLDSVLLAG